MLLRIVKALFSGVRVMLREPYRDAADPRVAAGTTIPDLHCIPDPCDEELCLVYLSYGEHMLDVSSIRLVASEEY